MSFLSPKIPTPPPPPPAPPPPAIKPVERAEIDKEELAMIAQSIERKEKYLVSEQPY